MHSNEWMWNIWDTLLRDGFGWQTWSSVGVGGDRRKHRKPISQPPFLISYPPIHDTQPQLSPYSVCYFYFFSHIISSLLCMFCHLFEFDQMVTICSELISKRMLLQMSLSLPLPLEDQTKVRLQVTETACTALPWKTFVHHNVVAHWAAYRLWRPEPIA